MIRPRYVGGILRRHLRELFREKRTIAFLILIPAFVVLIFTVSRDELLEDIGEGAARAPAVAVVGGADAAGLIRYLENAGFTLVPTNDVERELRAESVPVGLIVPRNFDRKARAGDALVTIVTGASGFREQLAERALSAALERYATELVKQRLVRAGIPARAAQPVRIQVDSIASSAEQTGSLVAAFLPFMIFAQVVGMMTGAAADVTVGEKERRTVEALLATPMSRREIVMGKWLVVVVLGVISAGVTLAAGVLSFRYATSSAGALAEGATLLPAGAYGKTMLAVLAFILLIASLQILIGFFARSQQQAGIMLSPVFFLAVFPLFFFEGQSGANLANSTYAIPGLGATLLARNGLAGTAAAVAPAIAVASHLLYAAVVLVLADRVFHSERALLRSTG